MATWTQSSEARALHAVIDGHPKELAAALDDYSASELRRLADAADELSEYCTDTAEDRD
jgi:hypothetical protein